MTPAQAILGWERFTMLRFTQPEDAGRVLRAARHLISPDGVRFAPVQLMHQLAMGKPFDVAERDAAGFTGLRGQLEAAGWKVRHPSDDGFEAALTAWARDAGGLPGPAIDLDDRRKDLQFVLPA